MILLNAPVTEPVTVAEVKLAARIDGTAFDTLLPGLISAARELAEHDTGRLFAPQTWRVELSDWPASTDVLPIYQPTDVDVSYWNGSDWVDLLDSAVDWAGEGTGTVVAPSPGSSWPALGTKGAGARVRIDIAAGLAPELVPAAVKLYIKAMVAHWKDNPEAAGAKLEPNPFLSAMLDTVKVYA